MSWARRFHRVSRRDDCEKEIVDALHAAGASVTRLDPGPDGAGVPDLLVGWRGETFLLECKMPLGPKGGVGDAKLSEDQLRWWAMWKGGKPVLVRSSEEALRAIGAVL
jgi:Holliday junction resolvase